MPTEVRPLLWKMRDAPVHLLGTFHLGPPDGYSLGQSFSDAFGSATSLVCEVGPQDKVIDPALLQRRAGSLAEDLGADLYAQFLADPRYNTQFEAIHPVAVISNLVVGLYTEVGLTPAHGVDPTLEQQALVAGKTCGGFETYTDQLVAMMAVDHAAILRAFDFFLNKPEFMREMRDLVIGSFLRGDTAGMQTARDLMARWSTSLAAKLLAEREARWLPRLQTMATENTSTVVAVGSLHLVGRDGLIASLAASGILADRIES